MWDTTNTAPLPGLQTENVLRSSVWVRARENVRVCIEIAHVCIYLHACACVHARACLRYITGCDFAVCVSLGSGVNVCVSVLVGRCLRVRNELVHPSAEGRRLDPLPPWLPSPSPSCVSCVSLFVSAPLCWCVSPVCLLLPTPPIPLVLQLALLLSPVLSCHPLCLSSRSLLHSRTSFRLPAPQTASGLWATTKSLFLSKRSKVRTENSNFLKEFRRAMRNMCQVFGVEGLDFWG